MASIDHPGDLSEDVRKAAAARWRQQSGQSGQDTPERIERIRKRNNRFERAKELRQRGLLPSALERIIGPTMDITMLPPSEQARAAGRPVARIVERAVAGVEPRGFGTGFLVAPGIVMTNHHVLPRPDAARGRGAHFLYEQSDQGTSRGVLYALDPATFFIANREFDYALCWVREIPVDGHVELASLGTIRLIEATPKIVVGDEAKIIQHPEGGPKSWAYLNNRVIAIRDDGFLHYETDTKPGSSGSPVFNQGWEVVALHHSGVAQEDDNGRLISVTGQLWTRDMGDDAIKWIANEGIRISAIVKDLKSRPPQDPNQHKIWQALIDSTRDPLDALDTAIVINTGQLHESVAASQGVGQAAIEKQVRVTWRPHEDAGERRAQAKIVPVGATISVGRHSDREITLPDERVSRNHARLTVGEDHVAVEDLNSSNGTFLDGKRIDKSACWRAGQKLRIGNYALELQYLDTGRSAPDDRMRGGARPARALAQDGSPGLGIRPLTISAVRADIVSVPSPALVVGMFEHGRPEEGGAAAVVNAALSGELARLIQAEVFGRGLGQISLLPAVSSGGMGRMVLLAGLGPMSSFKSESLTPVAENITRVLIASRIASFSTVPIATSLDNDLGGALRALVTGVARALHNAAGAHVFTGMQICEINEGRHRAVLSELAKLKATSFFDHLLLDVEVCEGSQG